VGCITFAGAVVFPSELYEKQKEGCSSVHRC